MDLTSLLSTLLSDIKFAPFKRMRSNEPFNFFFLQLIKQIINCFLVSNRIISPLYCCYPQGFFKEKESFNSCARPVVRDLIFFIHIKIIFRRETVSWISIKFV